ncbi:hypothetical protein [Paenibacillus kribbensis]|uniref:hypothetical protein n=1 Tax=Paenibacillus kribbensis TaxID=172713 RepID=UPI000A8C9441|nr:hypothetical protein [Paenibacillus kribbensis]
MLLAALITSLFTALVASNVTVIRVTGVIGAFGAVIAYILAEAYVEGKSARATSTGDWKYEYI